MKTILTRKFLRYFLISFSIFLGIMLIQYINKYSDDIFIKGVPLIYILQLIFHASLSFFNFSLSFGLLIASIFSFRYYSKNQKFKFKNELISSLIIMIIISFMIFIFNNWILPKSELEMRALLYDITHTTPGEDFQRIDKDLLKDNRSMITIKKINYKIDTLNIQIDKHRYQCDSILALLPDSIARENYYKLKLASYRVKYNSAKKSTLTEEEVKKVEPYLRGSEKKLYKSFWEKRKLVEEKSARIVLPINLFLLFIIGASFGFYYNDQKSFLLVILGLFTSLTFNNYSHQISQYMFGTTNSTITSVVLIIVMITVTIIFLILGLQKEQKITQPNRR